MQRKTFMCLDTHKQLVYVEAESREIILRELPGYRILRRALSHVQPSNQQDKFSLVHQLRDIRVWTELFDDELPW